MPRHVALLRGINVGGHRIKMDELRRIFEAMGFSGVETFLASGNVIFSSPDTDTSALAGRIEAGLEKALGYAVPTFLRSGEELRAVIEGGPFDADADGRDAPQYVVFLDRPPDDDTRAGLAERQSDTDTFRIDGREIHWRVRGRLSESPVFRSGLDRVLGHDRNTVRKATMLRRLVAKAGADT